MGLRDDDRGLFGLLKNGKDINRFFIYTQKYKICLYHI
jgi:hypothetical protein